MTQRRISVAFAISLSAASLVYGQSAGHMVTTTVLPKESGDAVNPNGFVIQQTERKTATLTFDLSGLPPGLGPSAFSSCTLRIVASKVMANTPGPNTGAKLVTVKGSVASDKSIVSLSLLKENEQMVAKQANPALCAAIYEASVKPEGNKELSISLSTDTDNASSIFYSRKNAEPEFSRMPRLVIEYKSPPLSFLDSLSWDQPQHDPEHTGRSEWKPFNPPSGFMAESVSLPSIGTGPGTLAGYPSIYQGNLYIIYKIGKINYLVCLDFSGRRKLWEAQIGEGTVERSPVIGSGGLFYAVTEKKITAYDLNRTGTEVATYPLTNKKLTDAADVTVGNDGGVFLALQENNVNYMLALTSKLVPFIRSTSFAQISTITASASGDKIFAQTPDGAAVIDIANPNPGQPLPFKGGDRYYIPVAGPAGGIMLFSAFNAHNVGSVWSYAETQKWKVSGTATPQPALGGNGHLYFIQDGKLKGYLYSDKTKLIEADKACSVSSNLVVDGSDNIYSWDGSNSANRPSWCTKGSVRGYKPDGSLLVQSGALGGPEENLRLQLAPDGTLWTNNENGNKLFALKPTYAAPDLRVTPGDIRTHTFYRATGKLTIAENVTVGNKANEPPMQVLFEAKDSISFAKGFRVEKGASILCRTGF
jgi:outer membrane protein assembly factor BamB